MAKLNSKNQEINLSLITKHNALTGGDNLNSQLYYQLKMSISKANQIDIIVSFVMESGIKLILDELKFAIDRGVKVRILTGNYLNITQPSALYKIKNDLNNKVDLRLYNDTSRSFHPKAYIFHYDDFDEVYIGSSNISKSALTSGIEWNYKIDSRNDSDAYNEFYKTFEDLFNNQADVLSDKRLAEYARNWHRPSFFKDIEKTIKDTDVIVYEPRGAQNEALYALNNTREEGADKALVLAATGVGKTYLAAFDSREYQRVLFVAHREEILKQAANSFKNVRPNDSIGFFDGNHKDVNEDIIFASVNTLGNDKYLNEEYFDPKRFDYIVIDEFHHAVNKQYTMIANYFKPKFLLGLTATPDRMDGRNIYELCNYNVPFEISMRDAINQGILVPFRYYGIYDDTDYSEVKITNGRYSESELTTLYKLNFKRKELIYKHYLKYNSKRALGFCCSRMHAEEMSKYFNEMGIPATAVYSNADSDYSESRDIAINELVQDKIKVIFSVDMFNEGLDIPSLDMVMFLRPTESPIVFTQQLGRGLRTYPGKDYLHVLDFIGNYKKAGMIPLILRGREVNGMTTGQNPMTYDFPDGCLVDFDLKLIDLFKEMDERNERIRINYENVVIDEYLRIKNMLKKVPTRNELFTYMDDTIYGYALKQVKLFKDYLAFKAKVNDLSLEENELRNSIAGEFLNLIETTNMSRVYKMVVLSAFYNNGNIRLSINEDELLKAWKDFFSKNTNWKDLIPGKTYGDYLALSDKWHIKKIDEMPIKYLVDSGKGFFIKNDYCSISLNRELESYLTNPIFIEEFKDIMDYRTNDYYYRRYHDNRDVH